MLSYSLPPNPPVGGRDIRFSGDTKLCTSDECLVEIMNPDDILRINYELQLCESSKLSQRSTSCEWILVNEKTGEEFYLSGTGKLEISGDVSVLILRKSTSPQTPIEFALFVAHPNPFNPVTTIRFTVPELSDVNMVIYDIQGRLVETLVDEQLASGNHIVQWDAEGLSSGMYFILLEGNGFREIQKVVMMK